MRHPQIELIVGDELSTIFVFGDFDFSIDTAFRTAATEVLDGTASREVADLAGVTFCDSSAIGALVAAHKFASAAGKTFIVRNPSTTSKERIRLAGLAGLLLAEPS